MIIVYFGPLGFFSGPNNNTLNRKKPQHCVGTEIHSSAAAEVKTLDEEILVCEAWLCPGTVAQRVHIHYHYKITPQEAILSWFWGTYIHNGRIHGPSWVLVGLLRSIVYVDLWSLGALVSFFETRSACTKSIFAPSPLSVWSL